ncbi:ABC transporter permease [Bacteroidota bacterium]
MLKNYLKTAIRNLRKQRAHSIINIVGLAIGMAVFILILSYVWFELSFDRFHSKADQIYRVVQNRQASTGNLLAQALKDDFPEILEVTRLRHKTDIDLHYGDEHKIEMKARDYLRADPSILDIFDITLVSGDPETALNDLNSIVLTEELAMQLYGDEDPMGKIITITRANTTFPAFYSPNLEHTVTGIAKAMPENSHFSFKFLVQYVDSEDWYAMAFVGTYIVLPKDYPPERLEEKFPGFIRKYFAPEIEEVKGMPYDEWVKSGGKHRLNLQPLKDIHMDSYYSDRISVRKGNKTNVYLFSIIAFSILLLACINFMIMSTARSANRTKEVGIRKITGSFRGQLIGQFLTESIMLSILALILSVPLVKLLLPIFNDIVGIQISLVFSSAGFILFILLAIALIVGILAGSYPAFFLSAFQPVDVLKGGIQQKTGGLSLRNTLIVFQFIISTTLIVASLVVYNQLFFMREYDPGFDKENIVVIKNARSLWTIWEEKERQKDGYEFDPEQSVLVFQTFKQELLKHSHVLSASVSSRVPGGGSFGTQEYRLEGADANEKYRINTINTDSDYIMTFGLKLIAGHNISTSQKGIIINETAVEYFGWAEPLGKNIITRGTTSTRPGNKNIYTWFDVNIPVIGVIKDFQFKSLRTEIQPLGLSLGGHNFISVKIQPHEIPGTLEFLEKTWNTFAPEVPFVYSFLDDDLDKLYGKEERLGKIFLYFTVLAIVIACLGIYGLAAFTAEQRTKEIGVRKVMGASVQDIIKLLSKKYIILIIIANFIAWPIGYFIMQKWLQNFAYRINIGIGIFLLTGLMAIIIVIIAVSSQAIKASLTDPVESLRYE